MVKFVVDQSYSSAAQPTFGRRGLATAQVQAAGSSARGQRPSDRATAPTRSAIWDDLSTRDSGDTEAQENFGHAGFWIRVFANFVDTILVVMIVFGITLVATRTMGVPFEAAYLLMAVIVPFTYYPLFHSGGWQATPGKRLAGVYVARSDGGPLSVPHALGRYVAFGVSIMTLGIGLLIAAFHGEKKALHDHLAGTRAVRGRIR